MKITVQDLRQDGFKVQVGHWRFINGKRALILQDRKNTIRHDWDPKSGKTTVKITKDGIDGFGKALCHVEDNYNRKVGVKIALKQAVKDWFRNLKLTGQASA